MLQTSKILYRKLQRQYSRRINLDLKRIKKVLEKLNNPEAQLQNIINIIGSDGKNSVLTSLKYFLEAKLRRYHSTNNHLMSIQPTGVFGLYEEKNDVRLPERIELPAMKKK